MFKEINSLPDLPQQEKETAEYWKSIDVVEKLKELRKGSPEKVYYDGPITANGMPHYGHAITWTLKDIIPRYWLMQGHYVDRSMGWDTKGILVEYEAEKELGFTAKEDIKKYGEAKFIQYCRDFVSKFQNVIMQYEQRLGRWFDPAATYSTANKDYVESMWWALKELYNRGLLYEGHKTVAYDTRAGMPLSSHEVADGGYKEMEDPFVTVKFKQKGAENTYFLAWTTTPWTIPGNLMLAANKELDYVKVLVDDVNYIVAKARLEALFPNSKPKIIEEFKGEKLEGLEYEPPFDFFESKRDEGCFKVIMSGHANADDGTGIVHLAPYGEEDYDLFMKMGIKLFDYLDETAHFTEQIPPYQGLFYKQANPKIIEDLKTKGVLFETGTILHRMPIGSRTGTPLIYKPVKSWYIATTKLKDRLLAENERINWYPEHLKSGNSGMWIQNAHDWALSRTRYWGTPLPVWINDKTGEKVFIGSFEELEKLSGQQVNDPHRPFVDEITWEDGNGGTFRRVKDVIDVWFDSAAMPFAQLHYPFEGQDRFKEIMPADYIAEGPDQVRLWFYVMHVLGVALFDQIPYKNVVTIGTMLDENGKKMSKSKRNYKPMDEVLDEYGADILRYFILNSNIVRGSDAIFKEQYLLDSRKQFFLILWNSLKYFTTYANLYNFTPTQEKPVSENVLDKWILARLQQTINNMTEKLDHYQIMEATNELEPLSTDLSTWYIRRSRDRIKNGDMAAIHTLYYVLTQIARLMAPMMPFLSEKIFEILNLRDLTGVPSVHMDRYPLTQELSEQETLLLDQMAATRQVVSDALAIRVAKGLKVRQPLNRLFIESETELINELIVDEVNVKSVNKGKPENEELSHFVNQGIVWLESTISEELKLEGVAREMIRAIQDLRKEYNLAITDRVDVTYQDTADNIKAVEKFSDEIKQKVLANSLKPGVKYEVIKA